MSKIKTIIDVIDRNDFIIVRKYVFVYLFIIVFFGVAIQFFFIWKKNTIKENIVKILEKKKNITRIINKKIEIAGLKTAADEILGDKEKFRLKDYVYSILAKNNLAKYIVNPNEVITAQKLKKEYTEYSMSVELSNLSTQEVLDILAIIENDIRVYLKSLVIKNLHNQKVSLQFLVATVRLT